MAFRKTVKSDYFPDVSFHQFGETKFQTVSSSDSCDFQCRVFEDLSEISSQRLPLVSLDTIIKSGEVINGTVSFGRSDPALIESDVHSSIATYVQNHMSNNLTTESHEN